VADHSNHRQNDRNHAYSKPESERNPAPHFGVVGGSLRPGDIPGLQFSVHLRCVNDGRNTGRNAAKNSSQDREHKVILDRLTRRQDNSGHLHRHRWDGRLQIPSALNAYRCIIRVTGSALRTKHFSPPGDEISSQHNATFKNIDSKFARNILFAIACVNALH
jgi:hypothetical protein